MYNPYAVPTPTVILSSSEGVPYEGLAITFTCTATLPPSVDTDVNVTVLWSPDISMRDRVNISAPSTLRYPFVSTLTIGSLSVTDAGLYYCEAIANSSSQYIVASDRGKSPPLKLIVKISEENFSVAGNLYYVCLYHRRAKHQRRR